MESTSAPDSGPPPTPVLAAVIVRGGRYLVGLRPAHKRHGGLWEFPGGKVHTGEDWLAAARRELREELGVDVTGVGRERFVAADPGAPFTIHFVDVAMRGEPRALEHAGLRWATAAELRGLPLAPADARFVAEALGDGGPAPAGPGVPTPPPPP